MIDSDRLPAEDSCRLANSDVVVVGQVGERLETNLTATGLSSTYNIVVEQAVFGQCDTTEFHLAVDGGAHLHPRHNVLIETRGLVVAEGDKILLGLHSCPTTVTVRDPAFFGRLLLDDDDFFLPAHPRDAELRTEFGSRVPQRRLSEYVSRLRETPDPCGVEEMRALERKKRQEWREKLEKKE